MAEPLSPWADQATLPSPDGAWIAIYEGQEVGMGAPTGGTLKIVCGGEEKQIGDWVAASFVWSTDSRYLAFAEWTRTMMQTLCVYCVTDGVILRNPEEFQVLEFHKFESDAIKCVDSPIYMKRTLSIRFNDNH